MSFTDIDGYYLPAEVDAKFDEAQAEIDELKSQKKLLIEALEAMNHPVLNYVHTIDMTVDEVLEKVKGE